MRNIQKAELLVLETTVFRDKDGILELDRGWEDNPLFDLEDLRPIEGHYKNVVLQHWPDATEIVVSHPSEREMSISFSAGGEEYSTQVILFDETCMMDVLDRKKIADYAYHPEVKPGWYASIPAGRYGRCGLEDYQGVSLRPLKEWHERLVSISSFGRGEVFGERMEKLVYYGTDPLPLREGEEEDSGEREWGAVVYHSDSLQDRILRAKNKYECLRDLGEQGKAQFLGLEVNNHCSLSGGWFAVSERMGGEGAILRRLAVEFSDIGDLCENEELLYFSDWVAECLHGCDPIWEVK